MAVGVAENHTSYLEYLEENVGANVTILKVDDIKRIQRGSGIETTPLVTHMSSPGALFTTGMSVYPKGRGAPLHIHNCDEQVTLLEGIGEVEVDGKITPLVPYDSTYIPAGLVHAFRNTGDAPMRILWIYSSAKVTRTFAGSDEEVEHLSAKDLMGEAPK
jgi:mannose-6-phosphate isomerase-like protein (cupin superfamily)